MVEFKKYADKIIKSRYGIEVEHICATYRGEVRTYERQFYELRFNKAINDLCLYGFPITIKQWCTSKLKTDSLASIGKSEKLNIVTYCGIAADETIRIAKHSGKILPLVDIGWDESFCRQWCEENELLSPIYTTAARGGCWFCHNQGVKQLRLLRQNYPDLWALLMKWDLDSPTTFKADGRTIHDYDRRFELEDAGTIKAGDKNLDGNKFFLKNKERW